MNAPVRTAALVRSVLMAAAVWLTGCTSLPDVSPFATATRSLADAIRASGKAVSDEAEQIQDGKELSDELDKEWEARTKVMAAMVRYADSLSAIVDAANRGRETGKALAAKVEELAIAASLIPGAGVAGGAVGDAAGFVIGQLALMRGAKSLEEALEAAHPVVRRVAETLAKDLASLDLLVRSAEKNQDGQLFASEAFRSALDAEGAANTAKQAILAELAKAKDAADMTKSARILAQLAEIEKILAATRVTLAPAEEQQRAMKERVRATRALIAASSEALGRWDVAHQDLLFAIQNRRPVDVSSILQAVVEVRELVQRVKQP